MTKRSEILHQNKDNRRRRNKKNKREKSQVQKMIRINVIRKECKDKQQILNLMLC
jgi:hypothetical protein